MRDEMLPRDITSCYFEFSNDTWQAPLTIVIQNMSNGLVAVCCVVDVCDIDTGYVTVVAWQC